MFSWSLDGQLRRETTCVDVDTKIDSNGKRKAILRTCNKNNIVVFEHLKVSSFILYFLTYKNNILLLMVRVKLYRNLFNYKIVNGSKIYFLNVLKIFFIPLRIF